MDIKLLLPAVGLLIFSCFVTNYANAQTCQAFVEIPEANYDQNYSSIAKDGARPLGYDKGDVPFNSDTKKTHCVTISNMTGRAVEIAYETVPTMKLCVRDQNGKGDCKEHRYYDCYRSTADTMTFEFYCSVSQGCSESDVTFWFRMVRGPPAVEDPEGMWCQWRTVKYPESLAPLPPNVVPPQATTPRPVGAASGLSLSGFCIFSFLALFVAV